MEAGMVDKYGEPLSEAEAEAAIQDIRRLPKLMRLIQGSQQDAVVSDARRSQLFHLPRIQSGTQSQEDT